MIHQFKLGGYHIVLDPVSGAVHQVDEVAYRAIEGFLTTPKEELIAALVAEFGESEALTPAEAEELWGQIDGLKAAGKLYTPDVYQAISSQFKNSSKVIKAMCLHVAHTCNLTCSYCFARQGAFHGDRALLSYVVGKLALDFVVANSGSRRNLVVDFFGGEPLMNWQVVKDLVAYGRELERIHNKVFRFTLTTNGMLVDEDVIEFSNREMQNVVLSLDGRKEVHDRFRTDGAGRGSYDTIVPKFQEFAKARGNTGYYMRGTYTAHNPDFAADVLHMADLGFDQLSMEPVVSDPNDPAALTEAHLPQLFAEYEKLAFEMAKRHKEGKPLTFYHYILDLKNGPCIHKRIAGCGSGTEYMAVTPWGELFPCHQFVGDEKYSLGNVFDGLSNPEAQEEFRSCNLYTRPECVDCWARFFCSGGCPANSFHATGTINGVHEFSCTLFKKRIECAIMLQLAIQEEEGT